MDTRQTERFLDRLFDDDDRIEVAFIKPDGKALRRERSTEPGKSLPQVLDEMARAETAGFNVYVSALPLASQAENVYDRVWVDQDDPAAPWPFGADPRWDGPAWPKPTTLVRTSESEGGFRWQAIWLLDRALPADDGRALVKRLAARCGGDAAVHDPRRVLRVPGLMNVKRGSMSRLVDTTTGTISPDAFKLPVETLVDELLNTKVSAPQHILGEWLEGTAEGDRSRKAYVTARFLKGCGVEWSDAGAILKVGALRCNPVFEDRELEHVLNSAYHRQESR